MTETYYVKGVGRLGCDSVMAAAEFAAWNIAVRVLGYKSGSFKWVVASATGQDTNGKYDRVARFVGHLIRLGEKPRRMQFTVRRLATNREVIQ